MSVAPVMVICNKCGGKCDSIVYMPLNHSQRYFSYTDVCDKCGGSGKIAWPNQ